MKAITRRTFLRAGGLATAAVVLDTAAPRVTLGQAPIKVGFPVPLTGPYGAEAADQQAAATLAVEEINGRGGVLGRKVELLVRDDQLKPGVGAQRTKELLENEKVDFVIGGLSAAVQMAINEQTKKAKVIYVSISQSNEITARPDWSPYTFHEAINPFITSHVVGSWAIQNLGKRIYVLYADYAFGQQLRDGIKLVAEKSGATVLGADPHPLGATDYSALFPRVQAAKPDVLVLANFGKDQLNSVKQAASFGLKSQMKLVCPVFLGTMRREGGPTVFDGVYGGTTFYWEIGEKIPTAKRFADAFRKKYDRPPYDYAGYAYSGTRLLLEAVQRAKTTEADKVIAALEGHTYDYYKGKQWIRKCDHQSFQDVYVLKSKKDQKAEHDIFDVVGRVEASEKFERSCKDLGHA
ncbi:MAG: ABC transporter substrate-binding protein [Candidatus Rokubacteria bacterium]|nr:ABC transporter substrate-binding protein [Candidatus Rokubacteria bacterium]